MQQNIDSTRVAQNLMASWQASGLKQKLIFTFANILEESDIEREFFTRLVKQGVHVKIESNRI